MADDQTTYEAGEEEFVTTAPFAEEIEVVETSLAGGMEEDAPITLGGEGEEQGWDTAPSPGEVTPFGGY